MAIQAGKHNVQTAQEGQVSIACLLQQLPEADRGSQSSAFRAFEVCVYNSDVRACLKRNEDHPHYSERWSDPQHTILLVKNEIELALRLRDLFPRDEGFVIEDLIERQLREVV